MMVLGGTLFSRYHHRLARIGTRTLRTRTPQPPPRPSGVREVLAYNWPPHTRGLSAVTAGLTLAPRLPRVLGTAQTLVDLYDPALTTEGSVRRTRRHVPPRPGPRPGCPSPPAPGTPCHPPCGAETASAPSGTSHSRSCGPG